MNDEQLISDLFNDLKKVESPKLTDFQKWLSVFLSYPQFQAARQVINTTGRAFVLKTTDNTPIDATREQIETILHNFAPELSATVSGTTVVFFHDRQNGQLTV